MVLVIDDDPVRAAAHHRDLPVNDRIRGPVPFPQRAGGDQREPEIALRIEDLGVAAQHRVRGHPVVHLAGCGVEAANDVARIPDRAVGLVHHDSVAAAVPFEGRLLAGARVEPDDAAGGVGDPHVAVEVEIHLVRPRPDRIFVRLAVDVLDEHGFLQRLVIELGFARELHDHRRPVRGEGLRQVVHQDVAVLRRQEFRIEQRRLAGAAERGALVHAVHDDFPGQPVFRRPRTRIRAREVVV